MTSPTPFDLREMVADKLAIASDLSADLCEMFNKRNIPIEDGLLALMYLSTIIVRERGQSREDLLRAMAAVWNVVEGIVSKIGLPGRA